MKKEIIVSGVVGLVVGVLVSPWLGAWFWPSGYGPMMNGWGPGGDRDGWNMMENSRSGMMGQSGDIDRHFIEQMIPHHEDAVAMAELALSKAEHKEIKDLAAAIKRDQTREIGQMGEWHKAWFGIEVPSVSGMMGRGMGTMMHGGMMGNTSDLSRLETAQPFDKAFIEEMIPHHQMAVMMAQMLLVTTDRPEMEKLGQDIIDAQTKEIEQMRGWYEAWY